MGKPAFAYLLLKEHPYGREMLRQILSEGFVPSIIISEDSPIGDEEREKFLKRIEGLPIAPSIDFQLQELSDKGIDVIHETVSIHNSEQVMPLIKDIELDLIVFGGTRIIRGEILDYPRDGVINSHPGHYLIVEGLHLRHGRFTMISQLEVPLIFVIMELTRERFSLEEIFRFIGE